MKPNLRDYIDPLGRWPRLFLDDKGVAMIEYVITQGTAYDHKEVLKYIKAPYELLDKIIKYDPT